MLATSANSCSPAPPTPVTYRFWASEFGDYHVVTIDLTRVDLALYWKGKDGNPHLTFENVTDEAKRDDSSIAFLCNAGIFNPDMNPVGLHIENGKTLVPINRNTGEGNFYLLPNGVFFVNQTGAHVMETANVTDDLLKGMKLATQSGPILVSDGAINSQFAEDSSNRKLRSGVGVYANGTTHFVISKGEVTFYDFASFFRDRLACANALYLDGAISRFHVPDTLEQRPAESGFAGILVAKTNPQN